MFTTALLIALANPGDLQMPEPPAPLVAHTVTPSVCNKPIRQRGVASHYGRGDEYHRRRTANGETFNMYAATAAHPWLRFGTRVCVTNVRNGRQIVLRINDRGPFHGGRIIDVSSGSADELGFSGLANVTVRY